MGRHDEGGYTCTANNEGGSTTETVFLKLKGEHYFHNFVLSEIVK